MRTTPFSLGLVAALTALSIGCADREEGVVPVGGTAESPVRQARFVRRLHLDLTGADPTEAELAADLAKLAKHDDAKTRAAIAEELLARPSFAALYVAELENRVFSGQTTDAMYALYCPIIQSIDAACASCTPTVDCSGCSCPALASLYDERNSLVAAAADLSEGRATTGEIERRFAATQVYRFSAVTPEAHANVLFGIFGRPAEPDEVKNAAFLFTGTLYPGLPSGLLFQRTGESYADLIDIVFTSEIYRDAAVDAVFLRYLGRDASATERDVFSKGLDPVAPDVRGLVVSVVSSKEYLAL